MQEQDHKFIRVAPTAVINTDKRGLEAYKKRKAALEAQNNRINNLEKEVSEIKSLLTEILKEIKEQK